MFPVPSHLPRTSSDHISSGVQGPLPLPDPVLDFLDPLLLETGPSKRVRFSGRQVRDVRENLRRAIKDNKGKSHDLLIANFPSVSSHIQRGAELCGDYDKVEAALTRLERSVDPEDANSSFLPPVLRLLTRHFTAVQARDRARIHGQALKALKNQTERVRKLEYAIYAGRSGDDWVIEELGGAERGFEVLEGHEVIGETNAAETLRTRIRQLQSIVIEQINDGFAKAVSFGSSTDSQHGANLSVRSHVKLHSPRILQTSATSSKQPSSSSPGYPLSQIYSILGRLGSLPSVIQGIQSHLIQDLLQPVLTIYPETHWRVSESSTDDLSILRLEMVPGRREVSDTLADTIKILDTVSTIVFPVSEPPLPQRDAFLSDVRTHALRTCLNDILIPSMPAELSLVSPWTEFVREAAEAEEAFVPPLSQRVIQPFFEKDAGQTWANSRRSATAEAVRRLVLGGWGGWDTMEVEREKVVTSVVEVEVDDPSPPERAAIGHCDREFDAASASEATSGEPPNAAIGKSTITDDKMDVVGMADDGWGFDGEQAPPDSMQPASNQATATIGHTTEEDGGGGWDFDDPAMSNKTPAPSLKPVEKPAREAKRLGKRVAKAKAVVDDDPWESGTESTHESVAPESQHNEPAEPPQSSQVDTDWNAWEEDQDHAVPKLSNIAERVTAATPKTKRKVLQQQTRVIKEKAMVSRACNQLLALAQEVLDESEQLQSMHFSSPSFASASSTMMAAATDVFAIYRALLPIHLAPQLRGVPTLAMQLYNDCLHLADRVTILSSVHPEWRDADHISRRLAGLGEHVFEVQLQLQRDEIFEVIDGANGFVETGEERAFRRCQKVVEEIRHNIERLSRMLKPVLPTTTYLSVLGYVLDNAVQRMSSDVLSLPDITEVESDRLNELFQTIHSLEALFILEQDQPSTIVAQVPHWLKFCYLSELLSANLIDITYLFDSGALIDFTTDELISLLRALFADSEKRDQAIEKIARGVGGVAYPAV